MLTELRKEREQIDEAILSLERLAHGQGRRLGKPPAWMKQITAGGRAPESAAGIRLPQSAKLAAGGAGPTPRHSRWASSGG